MATLDEIQRQLDASFEPMRRAGETLARFSQAAENLGRFSRVGENLTRFSAQLSASMEPASRASVALRSGVSDTLARLDLPEADGFRTVIPKSIYEMPDIVNPQVEQVVRLDGLLDAVQQLAQAQTRLAELMAAEAKSSAQIVEQTAGLRDDIQATQREQGRLGRRMYWMTAVQAVSSVLAVVIAVIAGRDLLVAAWHVVINAWPIR